MGVTSIGFGSSGLHNIYVHYGRSAPPPTTRPNPPPPQPSLHPTPSFTNLKNRVHITNSAGMNTSVLFYKLHVRVNDRAHFLYNMFDCNVSTVIIGSPGMLNCYSGYEYLEGLICYCHLTRGQLFLKSSLLSVGFMGLVILAPCNWRRYMFQTVI